MSPLNNATALLLPTDAATPSSYTITRSLRFNSSDVAYLYRTNTASGSSTTWTFSFWMKRTKVIDSHIFSAGADSSNRFLIEDSGNGGINLFQVTSGSVILQLSTSNILRDFSAWYHVVIQADLTNATQADRMKVYINGTRVTDFSTSTIPANTTTVTTANTNVIQSIGCRSYNLGQSPWDGYFADMQMVVGQALTADSFGQADSNGVWQPKQYTGTYGTNGFRLAFEDNSTATATGIGKDSSGNGNNWTPANISVTAGIDNDSLFDSPSNGTQADTGLGGQVSGNYCVLNPNTSGFGSGTLTQGNLYYALTSGANQAQGTIAVRAGKWWWEAYGVSGTTNGTVGGRFGFCIPSEKDDPEQMYFGLHWHATSGLITVVGNTFTQRLSGTNYGDGDTLGCALDADSNIAYFYKNGSLVYTYDFSSFVTAGTRFLTPHAWNASSGTPVWSYNFGQRPWAYAPRTNHKALCSSNMTGFTVNNGSAYIGANIYSGNNGTQTVSNGYFNPDIIWLKCRNVARNHRLIDVVRGVQFQFFQNGTEGGAAYDATSYISSVTGTTSTGFTLTNDAGGDAYNTSGETYAAWTWDSGTSTVTNNQGSIPCQLRANPTAGISFATYTVSSSGQSIGHGLGVTPNLSIVKRRDATSDWYVRYNLKSGLNGYVVFNSLAGGTSSSGGNATTIDVGYTGGTNATWIMWNLAEIPGFSAINSYTGNNSSIGAFIYTGFRIKWLMIKRLDAADTSAAFRIFDSTRSPYNRSDTLKAALPAYDNNAENAFNSPDFFSNGFKWKTNDPNVNGTGQYLYVAFAENPISIARAF